MGKNRCRFICVLGQNLLDIMEYYSRYPEILHLQGTTCNTVIAKIKSVLPDGEIKWRSWRCCSYSKEDFESERSLLGFHIIQEYSPAMLMMNRNLQTIHVTMKKNIHPQEVNHTEAKYIDEEAKYIDEQSEANYACYYYRKHSTSSLPPLNLGDKVRMRDDKTSKWSEPAQVVKEADTPKILRHYVS